LADFTRGVLENDSEESWRALGHSVVRAIHDQALDRDVGCVGHKNRRSQGRAIDQLVVFCRIALGITTAPLSAAMVKGLRIATCSA